MKDNVLQTLLVGVSTMKVGIRFTTLSVEVDVREMEVERWCREKETTRQEEMRRIHKSVSETL